LLLNKQGKRKQDHGAQHICMRSVSGLLPASCCLCKLAISRCCAHSRLGCMRTMHASSSSGFHSMPCALQQARSQDPTTSLIFLPPQRWRKADISNTTSQQSLQYAFVTIYRDGYLQGEIQSVVLGAFRASFALLPGMFLGRCRDFSLLLPPWLES